jgi:hypothetical protein
MKLTLSVLFCAFGVAIAAPAPAQTLDASGTWDLTFNTQNGPMQASMTIKRDGEKLAGTMQTPNGPFAIAMNGTLAGDALNGTVDFGGRSQSEWAAKRRAEAAATTAAAPQSQGDKEKVDVTGAWAFTIETGNGTASPSVTFKQDGEKLTGHYSSQVLGERDFTGTVKGNAINFTIDADIQGQAVKITYSGTVEKDTMKGKVVFGELGEGTFTGKKK